MSGHLIVIDKQAEICPEGAIETWRRLFTKCVLKATVPEPTNTCQDYQICAGSNLVIGRAVHSIQYIWDANPPTENWCFLLVVEKNAFNEINCIGILWTVFHLWPFVALFFNGYHH